jgi:hypothetical protein
MNRALFDIPDEDPVFVGAHNKTVAVRRERQMVERCAPIIDPCRDLSRACVIDQNFAAPLRVIIC